jgi:hypothetical protein
MVLTSLRASPPPRVYVYPNADVAAGSRTLEPVPLRYANGSHVGPNFYLADQGMIPLVYRGTKRFATSPHEADIFLAFMTPYRPPFHEYTDADRAAIKAFGPVRHNYMPNAKRLALVRDCERLFNPNSDFLRSLKYLTKKTASRHFVISEFPAGVCGNEPQFRGRSLTRSVHKLVLELDVDNLHSISQPPFSISMPYPSSIRWSPHTNRVPPWRRGAVASTAPRTFSFVGSESGQTISVQLRRKTRELCSSHPRCTSFITGHFPMGLRERGDDPHDSWPAAADHQERAENMAKALQIKSRSTFCIEPPGYSPPRKSAVDSMLVGCIPVYFMSSSEFHSYMPFHFRPWGTNASVLISPRRFLSGQTDLFATLDAIPPSDVERMQATIASSAHRLVYGLVPFKDDAVDLLMRGIHTIISYKSKPYFLASARRPWSS